MSKHARLIEIHMYWVPRWYSKNKLDGERKRLMLWDKGEFKLFRTRKKCEAWIKEHYSYIRDREDLRKEPHGWRLPKAVKVFVQVHECR